MGNIKIMSEHLANKIAAGEVVEKCVSVVKELVENSIDAKSTEIKIELIDAGTKEIKVTDNGVGMDKNDALLAFSRHATSKLLNEEDLFHINSLGFRGEALPSIASVSEVILKTSTGGVGTLINIKGGKVIKEDKSDSRVGTVITIKNLFYNTPARLKYLKSLYTELANVIEFVNKVALSHPNIKFVISNNDKVLLNTDGSNNILKVINNIYGLEITKKMIPINGENNDYIVNGYISMPEITKTNRNSMITIVNGRIVRNVELNKTINDAYHTYKPEDRYPIVVLNINVDPNIIDVNIHPTKQDIKFSKMEQLKDLVSNIIKNKLQELTLIPNVKNIAKEEQPFNKDSVLTLERPVITDQEQEVLSFEIAENMEEQPQSSDIKERMPELYPVGLVHGTYIVCQNDKGMYLIDQHAAKERINYEKYMKALSTPKRDSIELLIPINIELPTNEYIVLKENINIFEQLNMEVSELGINTISVKSHPLWLPQGYEERAIRTIVDIIVTKETFDPIKFNEKVAITLSCKLSIKANQNISMMEMESLISDLRQCDNPFTCPHGRPTVIHYSVYELEKLFKRSM